MIIFFGKRQKNLFKDTVETYYVNLSEGGKKTWNKNLTCTFCFSPPANRVNGFVW